jgi:rhodanese-related sulfurtransferase
MKYLVFITVLIALTSCKSATTSKTDSGVPDVPAPIREVSPAEAQTAVSKAYSQFIDVRTAEEYSSGHAARAVNIPLDTLSANLDKLERNEPVYVICQTGNRSGKAADLLKKAGFNNVNNVAGGTVAWQEAGLPMETRSPHTGAEQNPRGK